MQTANRKTEGATTDRAVRIPVPHYYPFSFGGNEALILSDGPLDLGDLRGCFEGVAPSEIEALLKDSFLPQNTGVLQQNALLVRLGEKSILFDTGMGELKMFGPDTGRLITSLREAGVEPGDIDAIVCSHAHVDHVGGICAANGSPNFPNALIYISERDFIDWTDERQLSSPLGEEIAHVRANLLPVRDKLRFFQDGEEFLPGVKAVLAPGHTLGHHCFDIRSGSDSIFFLADLAHHSVVLLRRPLMRFIHDADPALAAESRYTILKTLADQAIPVIGWHFPWPGTGHVTRRDDGFEFVPTPIELRSFA